MYPCMQVPLPINHIFTWISTSGVLNQGYSTTCTTLGFRFCWVPPGWVERAPASAFRFVLAYSNSLQGTAAHMGAR